MESTILVAVISGVGTLIGSIVGILTANRLSNYRIGLLEKKVEAHNNLVVRMVEVEQRSKSNTHRLNSVEQRVS